MEARRKEEEKHNEQLEADRRAARTLQEKLNEENRMLREQIGKNLIYVQKLVTDFTKKNVIKHIFCNIFFLKLMWHLLSL